MKKTQILGVIRHALTFIGGFLVVKGYIDESVIAELTGGISTLIGTIWSIFDKKENVEDNEE